MKLLERGKAIQYIRWSDVESLSAPASDTFFSPHLYDSPSGSLLSTCTVTIDTGEADLAYLPLTPTIVVQSSPTRTQSYFVFDSEIDEFIIQQIATSLKDTDLSSAELGHLMRLPSSLNTKYSRIYGGPFRVSVTRNDNIIHKVENLIPSPNGIHTLSHDDLAFESPDPKSFDPQIFIEQVELPPITIQEFSTPSRDPRASLRRLINELLRKSIPKGMILAVARASANNYTALLEYYQDEELRKLILQCAQTINTTDPKVEIQSVRDGAPTIEARREAITKVISKHMREIGEFSHLRDGGQWYMPKSRQPIEITPRSQSLSNFLDREFGLNAVDFDTPYVMNALNAFVNELPKVGTGAILSHYDSSAQRMLVHTGANNIHCITPESVKQIPNGSYGITLFPLDDIFVPFMPRPPQRSTTDPLAIEPPPSQIQHWSYTVFGPILDRILFLDPEETRAILTAWFLFLFFKNESPARPILALLGQPGSGKSTILKRVCHLLYGKVSGFMSLSNRDDFDQITSSYPLVVIDNLDTWEKWIPDALAQSAGAIDRGKRKQYTNNELFIYHRDAMVCLTAHDPKFGRADVADRLLILPMKRLDTFMPEGELLRLERAAIWYEILNDLRLILSTPRPTQQEQLRVMDFSNIGTWIASALGFDKHFRKALNKLHAQQRSFALENDQLLVTAILNYAESSKSTTNYKLVQQLFLELESFSKDPLGFQRKYRNAQQLGNKLRATQEALKSLVEITWETDQFNRWTWRIQPKPEDE